MAAKISVFRGTSYPVHYVHTDTSGASVPLTNKRLYFTVKKQEWDSDTSDSGALITKTIEPDDITDPTNGITDFVLTDADTQIDPDDYYFDVIIEDGTTGESDPPSLIGTFTVKPKSTNRNVGNEVV